MADRLVKYPRGHIEDVLANVGKFTFPVDFLVLGMEEDRDTPVILRRNFLAMGNFFIDVKRGDLKMRVKRDEETFMIYES